MKNKFYEKKIQLSKQYHSKYRVWDPVRQIQIYHCYDNVEPDALSWWDDVAFKYGKQKVLVFWQHPRMVFTDTCEQIAYHKQNWPDRKGLFDGEKKIYKKVGKSRKKVISYSVDIDVSEQVARRILSDSWHEETEQVRQTTDFKVRPSFIVRQYTYCRAIAFVAPVEIRNEDELKVMADMAKSLLTGKTSLDQLFPNYVYTKDDWKREVKDE